MGAQVETRDDFGFGNYDFSGDDKGRTERSDSFFDGLGIDSDEIGDNGPDIPEWLGGEQGREAEIPGWLGAQADKTPASFEEQPVVAPATVAAVADEDTRPDASSDEDRIAARAEGFVVVRSDVLETLDRGTIYADARVAGTMAAKRAGELIPACYPDVLTPLDIECALVRAYDRQDGKAGIQVTVEAGSACGCCAGSEVLAAASVACLVICDACRKLDPDAMILEVAVR